MPWNPEKYNQFKTIRYQPFFDLMAMISPENIFEAVDIGCGTGEQTSILAAQFNQAKFTGIDASAEMLSSSGSYENERLHFRQSTIEEFTVSAYKWDLIFSNAALQWSDQHTTLFPQLISKLSPGGQLAVQMPVQPDNILNKLLLELVQEPPFAGHLNNWKLESPVLNMDEYAQIMFDAGLQNIQISQKVYPIIAVDAVQLLDFISGSALIPYMERLPKPEHDFFMSTYKNRIEEAFPKFPAIYAFKRLLLYGNK